MITNKDVLTAFLRRQEIPPGEAYGKKTCFIYRSLKNVQFLVHQNRLCVAYSVHNRLPATMLVSSLMHHDLRLDMEELFYGIGMTYPALLRFSPTAMPLRLDWTPSQIEMGFYRNAAALLPTAAYPWEAPTFKVKKLTVAPLREEWETRPNAVQVTWVNDGPTILSQATPPSDAPPVQPSDSNDIPF